MKICEGYKEEVLYHLTSTVLCLMVVPKPSLSRDML
jgi:hypothetical protein